MGIDFVVLFSAVYNALKFKNLCFFMYIMVFMKNDNFDRLEFRKLNTLCFFQNQVIREKRNREKKNLQYSNYFNIAFNSLVDKNYVAARQACKYLRKKCLKWLLYLEFEYYCCVFRINLPSREDIAFSFCISVKRHGKFLQEVQKKLPVNHFIEKTYKEFIDFKNQEERYCTLPIKNIAVCATMSTGKSTFVNALLGRDVLPARNEASTAKITSVYDKDTAKSLLGFVQQDNELAHRCLDTTLTTINKWNDATNVTRIFLQGNLDGIKNNSTIVAVHDTPGTNNSSDISHYHITLHFLLDQKLDAIIYVANATQLCTIDEKMMLKEIYKKVIKPNNTLIFFILNKADCIDSERENIEEIMKTYKSYLVEIGFKDPQIFPVSSKTARILKMVKNGMTKNLTGKERKELKFIQSEFSNLEATGLPQVEKYIEQIIGAHND